jgi:carbonic anhydrase
VVPVTVAWFGGDAAKAQYAQSPIDITSLETTLAPNTNRIEYHYQTTNVSLVNTFGAIDENNNLIPKEFGALKANVPAGSYIVVDDVKYNLLQFHFHQPSEHELNGNRSPMEAHFVHLRAEAMDSRTPPAGFTDCRLVDRPVLVIGAFIVPGNADREIQKVFAPAVLPTDNTSPAVTVPNLDLGKLLPEGEASWRYLGSLTTPVTTCTAATIVSQLSTDVFPENVRWYVLQDVVHLPMDDMEKFHAPVRRRQLTVRAGVVRPARVPRPKAEHAAAVIGDGLMAALGALIAKNAECERQCTWRSAL